MDVMTDINQIAATQGNEFRGKLKAGEQQASVVRALVSIVRMNPALAGNARSILNHLPPPPPPLICTNLVGTHACILLQVQHSRTVLPL